MNEQQNLNLDLPPGLPPVTVVRRKKQRSIRIRVIEKQIVVSGPATIPQNHLLDFVREKSSWINKAWTRQKQRAEQLKRKREEAKGTLLLRGERKNIYDFPVPGLKKPRLVEHDKAVVYHFDPILHVAAADAPVYPGPELIRLFYRNLAQHELRERFTYWSNQLPFQPGKLTIRNQKTKWGSCSSRGTISLNWRLIKCPSTIMDYIIIHELCHLRHFNHSNAFWEAVRNYYPTVNEARAWIRSERDEIFGDF